MVLGYCQNFVSAQYLVNDLMKFDQVLRLCLGWNCNTYFVLLIYHRIMALGCSQNFVCAQYLADELI